jgi:hypothetical protein
MSILELLFKQKCKYVKSCSNFQLKGKYCEGMDYPKCGIFVRRRRGV